MKNALKNMTITVICFSLLGILLGICLIIKPDLSIQTIGILTGIMLIAFGASLIFVDIRAHEYYLPFEGFLPGVVNIILGILLFKNPADFGPWLSFSVGAWIIISSVNDIRMAFNLRHMNIPWILIVIINVVNICAGFFMFYNPQLSSMSIVTAMGIVMIVNSVIRMVDMFMIRSDIEEVEKQIRYRYNEIEKLAAEYEKKVNEPAKENKEAPAENSETK